jgi:hypothetical protein
MITSSVAVEGSAPLKMDSVSPPYRSYVLVSRDQIARNYRSVCAVVGPKVDVAAVVKSDAYDRRPLRYHSGMIGDHRPVN